MRMAVEGGQSKPKRIALNAATLDQARAELEKVRTENRAGKLALPGRRPSFAEFADEYLASVTEQKSASTRRAERVILGYWKTHLGGIALDKITPVMVKADREKRLGQGRGC